MRYRKETILKNKSEQIRPLLDARGITSITHYATYDMSQVNLSYDSPIVHIWSYGDRYFKLAQKYYNNPELWWIIAKFNNRPTENMNTFGDPIMIPKLTSDLLL